MRPQECPDWSQKLVYILPCVSLHLAVLELYPLFKKKKGFNCKCSVFLNSVSHSSKLLNMMGRVRRTP